MPTPNKIEELKQVTLERHSLLDGVFCMADGLKLMFEQHADLDKQSMYHCTVSVIVDPENPQQFWESGSYGGPGVVRTGDGGRTFQALGQPSVDNAFGHEPGGEFTLVKTWLGRDEDPTPKPDALALRYLAAHGPSLPADFAGWSGLKGAAAVLESLGEALVTRAEDGVVVGHDDERHPDVE